MRNITDNIRQIESKIENFSKSHNRENNAVKLLAVSKTKPAELIEQAYLAGQRRFGENYVAEGVEKIQQLKDLSDIEWHYIGPIQSNKTQQIADNFDWVQTLEREKIARRLNEQRPLNLPELNVLIQINISGEASKSGITPEELMPLAEKIAQYPRLKLRGLMAIDSKAVDNQATSPNLIKMAALFHQLQSEYDNIDTLSMGMTDDMESAIAAGSTMVRIGTAIFGQRDQ